MILRIARAAVAAALILTSRLAAQDVPSPDSMLRTLAAIPSPRGFESAFAAAIQSSLRGATIDRAGNVVYTRGSTRPRSLIMCPMDQPGWVVGGVRPDGYLTIRPLPGVAPRNADAMLEGQRIVVLGKRGPVPGVVGVRSIHLTRGRSGAEQPFTFDNAYVDVGARSSDEAASLGIRETTPVMLEPRIHAYSDRISSPSIGNVAACVAVLRTAMSARGGPPAAFAFVVEQGLSRRGALTLGNTLGPFERTLIVTAGEGDSVVTGQALRTASPSLGLASTLALRTWFHGTPVESVRAEDIAVLERRIGEWLEASR